MKKPDHAPPVGSTPAVPGALPAGGPAFRASAGTQAPGGFLRSSSLPMQGTSALPEGGASEVSCAPGDLRVLDWAGCRAAVSYTFDDANSSQVEHYEKLAALGVPFTFYLCTGKPESKHPIWARAVAEGHELGNHSHSHRQTGDDLGQDLDRATRFIEQNFGVRPWTMAAPFGSRAYTPQARSRFFINRGVQAGLILPTEEADPMYLSCFVPEQDASAAEFSHRIDEARAAGGWEIVLIHGFSGGTDNAYRPFAWEQFERAVRYTLSLGDVWVGTLMDIAAYWLGQKAVTSASVETRDGAAHYRWELPAHFPPNRKVRITTGSTRVMQEGRDVLPSERGDFDISLDARALTLLA